MSWPPLRQAENAEVDVVEVLELAEYASPVPTLPIMNPMTNPAIPNDRFMRELLQSDLVNSDVNSKWMAEIAGLVRSLERESIRGDL